MMISVCLEREGNDKASLAQEWVVGDETEHST